MLYPSLEMLLEFLFSMRNHWRILIMRNPLRFRIVRKLRRSSIVKIFWETPPSPRCTWPPPSPTRCPSRPSAASPGPGKGGAPAPLMCGLRLRLQPTTVRRSLLESYSSHSIVGQSPDLLTSLLQVVSGSSIVTNRNIWRYCATSPSWCYNAGSPVETVVRTDSVCCFGKQLLKHDSSESLVWRKLGEFQRLPPFWHEYSCLAMDCQYRWSIQTFFGPLCSKKSEFGPSLSNSDLNWGHWRWPQNKLKHSGEILPHFHIYISFL